MSCKMESAARSELAYHRHTRISQPDFFAVGLAYSRNFAGSARLRIPSSPYQRRRKEKTGLRAMHRFCSAALLLAATAHAAAEELQLDFTLNNGNPFPAIGLGIGNMQRDRIPSVLGTAMLEHGLQLVDTAHASNTDAALRDTVSYTHLTLPTILRV